MYNLGSRLEQTEAVVVTAGDPYLAMVCQLNNIANFLHQGQETLPRKIWQKRVSAAMYILAGAKAMLEGTHDPNSMPNKS